MVKERIGPHLTIEGRPRWQISERTLKDALDIGHKVQDFELDATLVGNTLVYVKPSNGGKHRVFAICADCGKHVPAGRLHQHHRHPQAHGARLEQPVQPRLRMIEIILWTIGGSLVLTILTSIFLD